MPSYQVTAAGPVFPNQIQLLAKALIKSPSSDKPPFDIPTSTPPPPQIKTIGSKYPNINLSGGVFLVVVLNGLDARIADEELVEESTGEADGEALGGTHHEAPERGTGGDTGHGLAGQGSRSGEEGVAVHDTRHNSFFNCAQAALEEGRRENRTLEPGTVIQRKNGNRCANSEPHRIPRNFSTASLTIGIVPSSKYQRKYR